MQDCAFNPVIFSFAASLKDVRTTAMANRLSDWLSLFLRTGSMRSRLNIDGNHST